MNIFDRINDWVRSSEASLVNLLSAIAPWAAPLAPAFLSYTHMVNNLAFPVWVAMSVAIVVEILGLSTISTALSFWSHNKRYKTEYKKAPVGLVIVAFSFYLAIILTMNVLLEAYDGPQTHIIAKALLTLLSIPAALILAVRTQHTELLNEIKEDKEAKRMTRSFALRTNEPNELRTDTERLSKFVHPPVKKQAIEDYLEKEYLTGRIADVREIVANIGVAKSTASETRKHWMEKKGLV